MNGTELYRSDGTATGIFFCEKCRVVHRDKALADACCRPKSCGCGAPLRNYCTKCDACFDKDDAKREAARFDSAEHVDRWDGPVFVDGFGCRDGFFENVDALIAYCEDDSQDMPPYVWTCDKVPVVTLDIDHILENATDDAYEGFDYSALSGIDELKAAMEAFNESNRSVVNWIPNYKRALLIKREDAR